MPYYEYLHSKKEEYEVKTAVQKKKSMPCFGTDPENPRKRCCLLRVFPIYMSNWWTSQKTTI